MQAPPSQAEAANDLPRQASNRLPLPGFKPGKSNTVPFSAAANDNNE